MKNCPLCGGPFTVEPDPTETLTAKERAILEIVGAARGRWLSLEALVNRLYADDPNGGPERAVNNVHVFVCRIRRKLGASIIESRPGYGYRIVPK